MPFFQINIKIRNSHSQSFFCLFLIQNFWYDPYAKLVVLQSCSEIRNDYLYQIFSCLVKLTKMRPSRYISDNINTRISRFFSHSTPSAILMNTFNNYLNWAFQLLLSRHKRLSSYYLLFNYFVQLDTITFLRNGYETYCNK